MMQVYQKERKFMGKRIDTLNIDELDGDVKLLYDFVLYKIILEYIRYYKFNNVAAGKRLRKNALTLKRFAEIFRKNIRESLSDTDE